MHRTQGHEPGPIPKAIYIVRRRMGLTQAQFARQLLVDRNSVSRYELGSFAPRRHVLLMLMTLAQGQAEERVFASALADAGFDSNFLASLPRSASIGPSGEGVNV